MTTRRKTGIGRMRALNIADRTERMRQGITGEGPFGPERWKIRTDEERDKCSIPSATCYVLKLSLYA